MTASPDENPGGGLSPRASALTAGFGLLVMTVCAPLAFFYFLPQGIVNGDGAATVELLRSGGTPYLIGAFFLFIVYVMDVVVAWALYWLLRPGQRALSQFVAWMRLVYTALAFIGLMEMFKAYDYANSTTLGAELGDAALQAAVMLQWNGANTVTAIALMFFGVHLLVLGVAIWRARYVPSWMGVIVALAGASYVIMHGAEYFAPALSLGWLMIFALGELLFMLWMLIMGWRLPGR